MITVDALLVPSSVTNSLIAVGNDGHHVRDRMVRACIAIICELCEYKQHTLCSLSEERVVASL